MNHHQTATLGTLACAAALAFACAGSSGAPREASSAEAGVAADADVQAALDRACYGCHSESGTLPWHAKLAPSAWFAGAAREKLDFSTWQSLAPDRRLAALQSIDRVVRSGEMPPWDSALFDGSEKLSPSEKERVAAWASDVAGATR